ncbi:hypothetical protein [Citrobacter braakii]|uniref:hypothetical protein n=1 Tax=Citrobacter braakii TaxID=57706 RepID=UPI001F294650|nr:hypothetical protein [Citrobacter braakii]
MTTITKERIELFVKSPLENGLTRGEQMELARIALASLEAEPVGYTDEEELRSADNDIWMWKIPHGFGKDIPLYTLPPAPVVPESLLSAMEEVLRISDRDHEAWHKVRNGIAHFRAAMLQAGTLINEGTIPATRFQQVADLYGITSPTGSETSFTFDAFEASCFAKGGWSVQEYVELERYQAAVTGNSPVSPDGLCPCCGRKPLKHRKCSVPGCGRTHVANGLCQRHYDMKRREDPEQVEKFREANRRFTEKKRAQKTSAPQQEVIGIDLANEKDASVEVVIENGKVISHG